MKRNVRGILAFVLLFCMMLTGCKVGSTSIVVSKPLSSKYVFKIGDMSCSMKEARLYLANFQNIYGTAYTLNLWEHDFGDESLETYIKNITLNELTSMVCMNQLAVEKEVTLDESDEQKIKEAAKAYYASLTETERNYLDVSENDLVLFYEHYGLARKVYQFLTGEINREVSDDEARVMDVMQIFVTDESKATEVSMKLRNGEDFASVANMYNEMSNIQSTICRADFDREAETLIFQMDNGQISDMIKVSDGYYFIKCINKYNKELTEENKLVILETREKEAFDDVYHAYIEGLSSCMNEDVWEDLKLDTSSEIRTNSFIDTYEIYCD